MISSGLFAFPQASLFVARVFLANGNAVYASEVSSHLLVPYYLGNCFIQSAQSRKKAHSKTKYST
jgi:hypothetical protein